MSGRRQGRELAAQMLYQADLGESTLAEIVGDFPQAQLQVAGAEQVLAYAVELAQATLDNLPQIDELIQGQADHWRLERMAPVDRNILRLAVGEFLFEEDVPKLVVVDEAIELAKRLGSEKSGAFVNGILDGMLKQHKFPGRMQ